MRYTSDELFHFVGWSHPADHATNYKILKSILIDRCISHPPHKRGWGDEQYTLNPTETLLSGELLVPNVVCFADIPVEALAIHIKKYGAFGLSLSRHHLVRYGARPVMYVPLHTGDDMSIYGRTLLKDIEAIFRSLCDTTQDFPPLTERYVGRQLGSLQEAAQATESLLGTTFLAFLKPFNAELDESAPDNFYMEREWRRLGNVCFESDHVCRILAPDAYVGRLRADCPAFEQKVESIDVSLS